MKKGRKEGEERSISNYLFIRGNGHWTNKIIKYSFWLLNTTHIVWLRGDNPVVFEALCLSNSRISG
jgi:uncharacterized protein (DUF2252 family)